eukprot:PhF_6_TR2234/c0_g1_i1/m.3762
MDCWDDTNSENQSVNYFRSWRSQMAVTVLQAWWRRIMLIRRKRLRHRKQRTNGSSSSNPTVFPKHSVFPSNQQRTSSPARNQSPSLVKHKPSHVVVSVSEKVVDSPRGANGKGGGALPRRSPSPAAVVGCRNPPVTVSSPIVVLSGNVTPRTPRQPSPVPVKPITIAAPLLKGENLAQATKNDPPEVENKATEEQKAHQSMTQKISASRKPQTQNSSKEIRRASSTTSHGKGSTGPTGTAKKHLDCFHESIPHLSLQDMCHLTTVGRNPKVGTSEPATRSTSMKASCRNTSTPTPTAPSTPLQSNTPSRPKTSMMTSSSWSRRNHNVFAALAFAAGNIKPGM